MPALYFTREKTVHFVIILDSQESYRTGQRVPGHGQAPLSLTAQPWGTFATTGTNGNILLLTSDCASGGYSSFSPDVLFDRPGIPSRTLPLAVSSPYAPPAVAVSQTCLVLMILTGF